MKKITTEYQNQDNKSIKSTKNIHEQSMVEYEKENIWIKFKDKIVSLYNGMFNRNTTNNQPEVRISESIGINEHGEIGRGDNPRNEFIESLKKGLSQNILQITHTENKQVREVSIDDLIKQVDLNSRATIHGRPTCDIFEDVVLLKYDNYRLVESDIVQTMAKMEKAKESGISFARILDYRISSTNEKRKSTGYVMQERATGSAVFDYTDDASLQNYRSAIVSFSQTPQNHFDKLVKDFVELTKQGLSIDTGNSGNFFYDKENGFTFIDLQSYKGEDYLKDEDSRQALSQNICSIFFDRYYSSKTPENEFEQVTDNAQKLLIRLKTALEKVGVTEQEFRYGVIETNDPFIKTVFAKQRQAIKSGNINDNPSKPIEVLKSEDPEER